MSEIQVKGLKELNAFLQQLPAKIEQNVLGGALRAGAKVIEQAARVNLSSNGSVDSAELQKSLRVSVRRVRGRVRARVIAEGGMNKAVWVEYGTAAHYIMVRAGDRPSRNTRRGNRTFSIRTINKMVKTGSLVIGKNFVGASVMHPGAKPKPYMRPALHQNSRAAVIAAANYIKRRLATKHGINTSGVEIE